MNRDAKNVLKSMIEKAFNADLVKLKGGSNAFQEIHNNRVKAFIALVAKDPSKYLRFGYHDENIEDEYEVFDSNDDIQLSKDGQAAMKKIEAQYSMVKFKARDITFAALNLTLDDVPTVLNSKYSKLADQVDIAVVSNEAVDLYQILKKALQS